MIPLKIGQIWRNDWTNPFSNAWNGKITNINGTILTVHEWLGDIDKEEDSVISHWETANFRVFYVRLIEDG